MTTNLKARIVSKLGMAILMASAVSAWAQSKGNGIVSKDAEVRGLKIHYLTGGAGPAVILLHGYTQTSRMWRPLIPSLTSKFTVIAPDLPGIGDSAIPQDGLDMKTAAVRIHGFAQSLGINRTRIVGHDIGLMVAYAYAAMYPERSRETGGHGCVPAGGRRLGAIL